MISRAIYWRCFHCGDAFTKAQHKHAQAHFGRDCSATPVCLIREPGEYNLLRAVRAHEDAAAARQAEDTEMLYAMHSMACDHAAALRREEDLGYARDLSDGRAE